MGFHNLLDWELGYLEFLERGFALIKEDRLCYERSYFGDGFHLLPLFLIWDFVKCWIGNLDIFDS